LEGKRFVHSHCYRADEILMLMNLADEFGFKVRTLQHVLEGYKVASEIARHGAMASAFTDFWGYKLEAYDAIPYDAAIMTRHGVARRPALAGERRRPDRAEANRPPAQGGTPPRAPAAIRRAGAGNDEAEDQQEDNQR